MSLIPEIIIQRILVNGIRQVRNVPWQSEQLLKTVPQSFAQEFHQLLTKTPVDVTINYPREDSQFPCVCILLRAEEESQIVLGDLLSSGYDDTSGLLGSGEFFFTGGETSSSVTYEPGDSIGDPPRIFDKKNLTYKESRGSGYSSSYLLQIMTDNQSFTIFLYHIIRFIILSNIHTLTANGIHDLRLSGTDFLPQAAQQPNFIFMRGINMNFLYFADHFLVEGDPGMDAIAKAFVIDMEDGNKKDFGILAEVQKLNITSVSPITMAAGTSVSWTYNDDGTAATSGISAVGINLQTGISVQFIKSDPSIEDGSPFEILGVDSYFTVSNQRITDVATVDIYVSQGAGTVSSTDLTFVESAIMPSNLSEGMFLQVIGPTTHDAYLEQRRIISFTSGSGGSITVANKFSGNLTGAFIRVIQEGSTLLFDLSVAADTPTGGWDVKFTNPDLISSTLTNSFTVT